MIRKALQAVLFATLVALLWKASGGPFLEEQAEIAFPSLASLRGGLTVPVGLRGLLTEGWRFRVGVTPLSDPWVVLVTCMGYCLVLLILQEHFKNREPLNLRRLLAVHNGLLSAGSLVLLAGFVRGVWRAWKLRDSPFDVLCGLNTWANSGFMQSVIYINYLFKYYELLDTLFRVLHKKPVSWLHSYHHVATLLLTYGEMTGATAMQWVPIVLNLFVHVVMYYYYMLQACGYKNIPWKPLVTVIQIVQFVLDVIACYWTSFIKAYQLYGVQHCYGTWYAAYLGDAILGSYLVLFVQLYRQLYGKRAAAKKRAAPAATEQPRQQSAVAADKLKGE